MREGEQFDYSIENGSGVENAAAEESTEIIDEEFDVEKGIEDEQKKLSIFSSGTLGKISRTLILMSSLAMASCASREMITSPGSPELKSGIGPVPELKVDKAEIGKQSPANINNPDRFAGKSKKVHIDGEKYKGPSFKDISKKYQAIDLDKKNKDGITEQIEYYSSELYETLDNPRDRAEFLHEKALLLTALVHGNFQDREYLESYGERDRETIEKIMNLYNQSSEQWRLADNLTDDDLRRVFDGSFDKDDPKYKNLARTASGMNEAKKLFNLSFENDSHVNAELFPKACINMGKEGFRDVKILSSHPSATKNIEAKFGNKKYAFVVSFDACKNKMVLDRSFFFDEEVADKIEQAIEGVSLKSLQKK